MALLTMRKFKQEKLWRDKLPVIMQENHCSIIHSKQLNDAEFDRELRTKLLEEADEVNKASSTKELIEELADLYEVIDTMLDLHALDKEQVLLAQHKKRTERGGFMERTYVTVAEHPEGSFGEKYCLAAPDKYPEIF